MGKGIFGRTTGRSYILGIKFYLDTDYSVAKDSLDYQYPEGAIQDNTKRPEFNEKLKKYSGSVLDIGCAGGGFVKTCIDEGRIAVGLEGTDFNKNEKKFEWATIPDNLFTCDVTKPFTLHTGNNEPYQFDIITAWEFFEHIEIPDLHSLMINLKRHLTSNGLIICSIDGNPYPLRRNRKIDLHRTVMPRNWWGKNFKAYSLFEEPTIEEYFTKHYLRESRSPNNYKFVVRNSREDFKTPLCKLAFKYGTDKCPQIKHHHTETYYNLFKDKINTGQNFASGSVKKVLEIGIYSGASLRMWKEFFPGAEIYGIDIDPKTLIYEKNITTFICDQTNQKQLSKLIERIGSDIDIVIEDGSHNSADQVLACKNLMPLLNKDVIYCIEDVRDMSIMEELSMYDCQYTKVRHKNSFDDRVIVVRGKND